ncbi:hypothetical protein SAMN05216337_105832 [Bradyrhizobium brasilense]|uniref:Uncharacterized protein n=1 Tax=Bradyrhizobium brasilense TaxID=1419277 RepID=A0A1G7LKD0_9BRAD|nr:hypothetical protein SAMN05216337_105832 [Bradyrhizobium brasilense]
MSPMGCVCSSRPMVQDQGNIVNNMPPLTSTILANPARRRPEIARRLMRERSSRGQRCQRRRLVSSITDKFPLVSSFRIDSTSFASAGAVSCCETCAAYTSWPAGQGRTVRTIRLAPRTLCQVHTAPRRVESGTAVTPQSNALLEPATGLAAKPQLEATVVRDRPTHQIQGIAGQARDHRLQRAVRRCISISQPEDPQLTSCPSAQP